MPFRPGVGVGGHCIPVDPLYLTWWARQNGSKAELVERADAVNHDMPKYVAERALGMVDTSITKPKVLILGVAYKAGIGDVRETPVSELRDFLISKGYRNKSINSADDILKIIPKNLQYYIPFYVLSTLIV